jgi:hypothetical protein
VLLLVFRQPVGQQADSLLLRCCAAAAMLRSARAHQLQQHAHCHVQRLNSHARLRLHYARGRSDA